MKILEIKQELKTIKRTQFGISIPELRILAKKIAKILHVEWQKFYED